MTAALGAVAWLFLVVAFGAIVPVVPTGVAVSGAAALAAHNEPATVVLVVVAGGVGAYVGDLVMFALCRWGGEQLARRLRWLRDPRRLARTTERLRDRQVSVLLVSRLLPGGRVPVLLAAGFIGLSWHKFVLANAPACALWSAMYTAVGLLGGAVFPEPWEAVAATVLLVLLISQGAAWWGRRRER
ncbi:MAG TPA: VTT domain-containing protein [Catenuloplanes sp.]